MPQAVDRQKFLTPAQESMVCRFTDAIAALRDIKTFHTDLNVASIRDELLNDSSDVAISDDAVWALEVFGIARGVATRFDGTQHYQYARAAVFEAGMLFADVDEWFDHRRNSSTNPPDASDLGRGANEYRAMLRKHLDWINRNSSAADGASAGLTTFMSPVTAYLQLIIRSAPMEHWDASTADPDSSPLAFAWTWAREIPTIQRRTADVVVIVTMGRSAYRNMAWAVAKAKRKPAVPGFSMTFLDQGLWASLGLVGSRLLNGAVRSIQSQTPSTLSDHYELVAERNTEEVLSTVRHVAKRLGDAGEEYARLLAADNVNSARVDTVTAFIRSWSQVVLAKAEPPAPEAVLRAIQDLAKTG